jgi:hypothetical protein
MGAASTGWMGAAADWRRSEQLAERVMTPQGNRLSRGLAAARRDRAQESQTQ